MLISSIMREKVSTKPKQLMMLNVVQYQMAAIL